MSSEILAQLDEFYKVDGITRSEEGDVALPAQSQVGFEGLLPQRDDQEIANEAFKGGLVSSSSPNPESWDFVQSSVSSQHHLSPEHGKPGLHMIGALPTKPSTGIQPGPIKRSETALSKRPVPKNVDLCDIAGGISPKKEVQGHSGLGLLACRPPVKNEVVDVLFDATLGERIDDEFGDFESVAIPATPAAENLIIIDSDISKETTGAKREQHIASKQKSASIPPKRHALGESLICLESDQTRTSSQILPTTDYPQNEAASQRYQPFEFANSNKNQEECDDRMHSSYSEYSSALKQPRKSKSAIQGDRHSNGTLVRDMRCSIPGAQDTVSQPFSEKPSSSSKNTPPTNIPQPSILLSLFASNFNALMTQSSALMSLQPHSIKDKAISEPEFATFVSGYIMLGVVAARIIAGRKLRWRRDRYLSQSTKIGPAQSGKIGGMKLAGLDKTEDLKEVREISEIVQAWNGQRGMLRSMVAAVKSKNTTISVRIPEVKSVFIVRTLAEIEGGLSVPYCCALCGLRRNERVSGVDLDVEDSFGEWWVEYWGHRACRNFWEKHEPSLR